MINKITALFPESRKIPIHITGEAIGHFPRRFWKAFTVLFKRKLLVIKRIDLLSHILDSLTNCIAVARKLTGRQVSADKPLVNVIGREHSTFEREHDPATEDRIK